MFDHLKNKQLNRRTTDDGMVLYQTDDGRGLMFVRSTTYKLGSNQPLTRHVSVLEIDSSGRVADAVYAADFRGNDGWLGWREACQVLADEADLELGITVEWNFGRLER